MPKRIYKSYSEKDLQDALDDIKSKRLSINAASKKYKIAKGTLYNKHKNRHALKIGRPFVFTDEEEQIFVRHMVTISEWGFPFDLRDLRYFIKAYLDKSGRRILRFKNNLPHRDWARKFVRRHKSELTHRTCQNIKKSKADLKPEDIKEYFENLKASLVEADGTPIDPHKIFNYDETNLSDDPGVKKCIFKRGLKYTERIRDSTKSSISIMFCGSATGSLIPPYVVYKAEHLWQPWIEGGPEKARYNRSRSGWFDATIFTDWFLNCFLPATRKIEGCKVLIGDNLSSHFSKEVLEAAHKNNVLFICIPKNSTHICQPLDVAFYGPLKQMWRKILDEWKMSLQKKSQTLSKEAFPSLLKKLCDKLVDSNGVSNNLVSGFLKTGIYPFCPEKVLERLPAFHVTAGNDIDVSSVLIDFLKGLRHGTSNTKVTRRSKINVVPGKSISREELTLGQPNIQTPHGNEYENYSSDDDLPLSVLYPGAVFQERLNPNTSLSSDSQATFHTDLYLETSVLPEIQLTTNTDREPNTPVSFDLQSASNTDLQTELNITSILDREDNSPCNSSDISYIDTSDDNSDFIGDMSEEELESLKNVVRVGLFVVVKLPVSNRKDSYKYFVGKIIERLSSKEFDVSFLKSKNHKFVWPSLEDRSVVQRFEIITGLTPPTETKRGFVFVEEEIKNYPLD